MRRFALDATPDRTTREYRSTHDTPARSPDKKINPRHEPLRQKKKEAANTKKKNEGKLKRRIGRATG